MDYQLEIRLVFQTRGTMRTLPLDTYKAFASGQAHLCVATKDHPGGIIGTKVCL